MINNDRPKVLFTSEIVRPEDEIKKKIEALEAVEKIKVDEHRQAVEKERLIKEEEKKKETELFSGGLGKLPSYQELFKSTKLPPLPQIPKMNDVKTEVIKKTDEQVKKPIFINKVEEKKIPQPPQLAKKPVPVFEEPKKDEVKPVEVPPAQVQPKVADETIADKPKMDYDALFGNDTDKN